MMIWNYNIRIRHELTMHVFVYDFRKGNILSQMQWKGLAKDTNTL
jgi:hypothetical protein